MRGVRAGPGRQGAGPGHATQLDQAGNGRAPEAPPLRDTCWAKPSERSGGGEIPRLQLLLSSDPTAPSTSQLRQPLDSGRPERVEKCKFCTDLGTGSL